MKVDIKKLKKVMAYLATIEKVPLEEIVWTDNGNPIEIDKEIIETHWRFTGLNNRDFAIMHIIEKRTWKNLVL